MTPFFQADSWHTVDVALRPTVATATSEGTDLDVAAGGDALRQALLLRLMTHQGALSALGHAEYGCRLHELIGEPNTPTTRLRARAFVLQALAQEQRVAEVVALTVSEPTPDAPDTMRIRLHVLPVGASDPLTLGLEVAL